MYVIKLTSLLFIKNDEWDCFFDLGYIRDAIAHENLIVVVAVVHCISLKEYCSFLLQNKEINY